MSELGFDLGGRTALVTGAARGIGEAISRGLAAAGATVVMADVDAAPLDAAATRIGALAEPADVLVTADVERLVERAVSETGRVDVVVNNAGILRDRVLWKLADDDWDAVVGVSLTGSFKLTRACVPHFRSQGYGRVINVTSYTGLHGNVGQAAYAAAKAGVIGLSKTAAKELGRFGVTVNAISPNASTRMIESIPEPELERLRGQIALGRFGEPDEMVPAVLFLASEEAGYVTGAVLPVDGGISM